MSASYLGWLGRTFAAGAGCLAAGSHGETHIDDDVAIVECYLRNCGRAIGDGLLAGTCPSVRHRERHDERGSRFDLADRTPAVMPFDRLAELVSHDGAKRLTDAGLNVHDRLDPAGRCPLSVCEIEWLRMLANGATVLEVAVETGCSERSMYRELKQLWARMRVAHRHEALEVAIRKDWI